MEKNKVKMEGVTSQTAELNVNKYYFYLNVASINDIKKQLNDQMGFIKFLIVWISQNLSIPFWVIGHIHLSLNIYKDLYEILTSFGLNIIVAIGFYLDWRGYKKNT